MSAIDIEIPLTVPADGGVITITGRTGSGKTRAAQILLEQAVARGDDVHLIDAKPDWILDGPRGVSASRGDAECRAALRQLDADTDTRGTERARTIIVDEPAALRGADETIERLIRLARATRTSIVIIAQELGRDLPWAVSAEANAHTVIRMDTPPGHGTINGEAFQLLTV